MDLAMRSRVDGFEMAIGRHFSAPGFCNGEHFAVKKDFDENEAEFLRHKNRLID